jgi:hypothetical protein
MSGRLIGIAWRPERRAPMQTVDSIDISLDAALWAITRVSSSSAAR